MTAHLDEAPTSAAPHPAPRVAKRVVAGDCRLFVIFDTDHDADLFDQIDAQSHDPGCGFCVVGGSEGSRTTAAARASVRQQIREADLAVIICGEHTESSPAIHSELRMAVEEQTPFFMLWGRREAMCKKPLGASDREGMYRWTDEVLRDQVASSRRRRVTAAEAKRLRRVVPGR